MIKEDFNKLGIWLNDILKHYNYQVSPLAPAGKPGKIAKDMREFRLQLINKTNDNSAELISKIPEILKKQDNVHNIRFNSISPNSSKFPSYTVTILDSTIDLVIGRGANKGENFETQTVADLAGAFTLNKKSDNFAHLIEQLNTSNNEFASVEILSVKQRTGSTKKEGIPIKDLGAIIGDIVLEDNTGKLWFISLKDTNGNTFSSYSGAWSIFDGNGTIQPNSPGSIFLKSFGVDLNQVQSGFDHRNKKKEIRTKLPIKRFNSGEINSIFERAWGMNYFYVRKIASGWKVFWIDSKKLAELTKGIIITDIRYPNERSKQISIYCKNAYHRYLIELRNSKAGEYPNDTKFKILD